MCKYVCAASALYLHSLRREYSIQRTQFRLTCFANTNTQAERAYTYINIFAAACIKIDSALVHVVISCFTAFCIHTYAARV